MQPLPDGTRDECILLVDAAADERAMYALALRAAGFQVHESVEGAVGLAASRTLLPDLIVADIVLPGLDGLALVANVRSYESTRDVPVILMTGYDQPLSVIADAKAAGATTVRVKPYLPSRLVEDARRLLEASGRLRTVAMEMRARARQTLRRADAALTRAVDLARRSCPSCGCDLDPAGFAAGDRRIYFQPCGNGCGWWFFDRGDRQMRRLT